jgi:hypothetical protein
MKKILLKTFLLFVVLLSSGTTNAQWQNGLWTEKQANNWYFPQYLGLTFSTSPPTALTNGQLHTNPDDYDINRATCFFILMVLQYGIKTTR